MTISETDIKLLWGRAAGICSNPNCHQDLTNIIEGRSYIIGEMAHMIARSPRGPRGQKGGSDSYDNLILLCPTCHTRIDKSPKNYSEEMLRRWKADHESSIRERGRNIRFNSFEQLRKAIRRILDENNLLWKEFGPKSTLATSDPGSNAYTVWNLRKIDTIIPNNYRVINILEANTELMPDDVYAAFLRFKAHALAFESHQYDRLDNYPEFPKSFEEVFRT